MRLILLGAPGSGKGTQGTFLADHFGVAHVSSGDLLRAAIAAETPLGAQARSYVERGDLVPDHLVLDLISDSLDEAVPQSGYVLDGFPRTLDQAVQAYERAVVTGRTADAVVYLAVPDDVARERLRGRQTGRVDDGDSSVIDHRLRVFHRDTKPLLDYYAGRGVLVTVDATRPPDEVSTEMVEALERHLKEAPPERAAEAPGHEGKAAEAERRQ